MPNNCLCGKQILPSSRACKSCTLKGNTRAHGWPKGKTHSDETREKISLSLTELYKDKSVHPRWKEDRSSVKVGERKLHDPLQKQWRQAVKNRDGWKCKIANGDCSGRLEAHHILRWSDHPELRYELNNGITLCHAHHPRKKEDEAKLSPFFQELVASQG